MILRCSLDYSRTAQVKSDDLSATSVVPAKTKVVRVVDPNDERPLPSK